MASKVKDDTKFVKVIISERLENKEYEGAGNARFIKQGGTIFKDGKVVAKQYTIRLDTEVELPENFIKHIKDRKTIKPNKDMNLEFTPLYIVEKVEG